MPYRVPWEVRRDPADDAEIAAFGAMTRREQRWWRAVVVTSVAGAAVVAAADLAGARPSVPPPVPRAECAYDGCFCRGDVQLEPVACPVDPGRPCLTIGGACDGARELPRARYARP